MENLLKASIILALFLPFGPIAHAGAPSPLGSWQTVETIVIRENPDISRPGLAAAFLYLDQHQSQVTNTNYLTLIDFDLPSTAERMYVIDLHTANTARYLVAHGKNSGQNYATRFSNVPGSDMSSLGAYLTGQTYIGKHGLSLILKGQEPTNSNAQMREIVLHGADYVSEDFIHQYGRLGRSDGCTAVSLQYSSMLSQELSNGSVLYIFRESKPAAN